MINDHLVPMNCNTKEPFKVRFWNSLLQQQTDEKRITKNDNICARKLRRGVCIVVSSTCYDSLNTGLETDLLNSSCHSRMFKFIIQFHKTVK